MATYNQLILSLGSNLGNRLEYLQKAVNAIYQHIGIPSKISSVYETPAWGFSSTPFLNCCLVVQTTYSAEQCLEFCLQIEKKLGRNRDNSSENKSYQARTIDIDILFYDDLIIETQTLTIPHPLLTQRGFVLCPLSEISPDQIHPKFEKKIKLFLEEVDTTDIHLIAEQLSNPKEKYTFSKINFLSIEGNIGAGKTSLSHKIAADFNARLVLEQFEENPFLPRFYEDESRYAFPLEMSFLATRFKQLQQGLLQQDLFSDFVVSDYYIYKSLLFAQVTLPEEEYKLYHQIFYMLHQQIKSPDLYVYLHQNTDNLLKNIKKRGRDYEQNIPKTYLEKIKKSYLDFVKTLDPEKVLILDVSDKDFVTNHQDYLVLLDEINKKIAQQKQ